MSLFKMSGTSVTRDDIAHVCQTLLECGVFEAVGTNVFCKDKKKKQYVFEDSKSALYRLNTNTHNYPHFLILPKSFCILIY